MHSLWAKGLLLSVFALLPVAWVQAGASADVAPLTLERLITLLAGYRVYLLLWLLTPPLLALLLPPPASRRIPLEPWRARFYSLLVFMVAIPGMLAVVLSAYGLFFLHQNLLQVDLLVYFLPILSMLATLTLIARKTPLKRLPGVDNIIGLMVMLGVIFLILLLLVKTRIWIAFVGPLQGLLVLGLVLFVVFRWALVKFTR